MPMNLDQRLALSGVVGLAALSAAQLLREQITSPLPALGFALGVMPNLTAAFAMPLILASFLKQTRHAHDTAQARRAWTRVLLFTMLGLSAWEFVQTLSDRFTFDPLDLIATMIGAITAHGLFGRLLAAADHTGSPSV